MTILPIGDLAASFSQKMHGSRIKADLNRMTGELASGKVGDLRRATGGDLGVLAALDHQMGSLRAFTTAAREGAVRAGALQAALGGVQDALDGLAPRLLQSGGTESATWIDTTAAEARMRFGAAVSALNTGVGGQSLLAGTATGAPALADADSLLADLAAAVSAETTAAGVEAAVTAWFDDAGGGFETSGYLGAATARAPVRVAPGETVDLAVTAADQRVRDVLKGFAMAALVEGGTLAGQRGEQVALLHRAGEQLYSANGGLTALRGTVGAAEAAIETALARNATEGGALELARNDIVAADPYRTAVDLEASRLQLEALYALTARLSRLTLTEFLR